MEFCDSFDHYSRSQLLRKWTTDPIPASVSFASGRTGTGMRIGAVYSPTYLIAYPVGECTVGVACKAAVFSNSLIIMYSTGERELECALRNVGDGRLYVRTTLGDSEVAPFVLSAQEWYYIEFNVSISSDVESNTTLIAYNVYINQKLILTGIISGELLENSNIAEIMLQGPGGGSPCIFDDLYISQVPLGDVVVAVLNPKLNATTNNWLPSSALKQNWELVKDSAPDDDATFIYTRPWGEQYDLYYIDEIAAPNGGRIQGVQICVSPSGAGEGPRHLGTFFKSTVGGDYEYSRPDYYYFLDVREGVSILELTLPIGVKAWD